MRRGADSDSNSGDRRVAPASASPGPPPEPRQLETPVPGARRGLAWGVSIAVHAAALIAVLWLFERAPHDPFEDLERLVFVEPAPPPPPPAPPAAEAATEDVPPLEAPAVEVAEVVAVRPTWPPTATRRPSPRTTPTARRSAPTSRPAVAAPAAAGGEPAATESERGIAGGVGGGVEGGTVGGTTGGLIGGVVGGRGDEVIRAEVAAKPPAILERVLPDYPPRARARRLEGVVLLRAIVDRQGRVEENVEILESSPAFDDAAVTALRRWRFTPGRDAKGNAVRVQIDVPMRFQLR